MNKSRRKELCAVADKLILLNKVGNDIDEADLDAIKSELESILYDEESYMDNMPENFQSGCRYQAAEEACNNIEYAIDALDDSNIDDAISYIYGATV